MKKDGEGMAIEDIFKNDMPGTPWSSGTRQLDGMLGQAMAQPSAFTMMGDQSSRLLQEYNQKLIEKFGYMTRRELKKKDMVDLRQILDLSNIPDWQAPMPKQDADDSMFCVEDYWYAFVPCFEEGAYLVNANRYIYWKLKDLDMEKNRMLLWLQDYIFYRDGCGWQPGVCGTVGWRFADPETEKRAAISQLRRMKCELGHGDNPGDVPDYNAMYALLDPVKDMRWNKRDLECWENLVLAYARKAGSIVQARSGKDNLDSLAHMFTTYTIKTNRILSEHKKALRASKQISREAHEAFTAEKARVLSEQGAEAAKNVKERRIRTVGSIVITSRSAPKQGRAKANYTKLAWKARGHFRTLKSGKRVYVRECVHRRKALLTPDTANAAPDSAPVTVVVRNAAPPDGRS